MSDDFIKIYGKIKLHTEVRVAIGYHVLVFPATFQSQQNNLIKLTSETRMQNTSVLFIEDQ